MSPSGRLAPHHRVFAAFAIYAFGLGQIFPRLPDVKLALGIEEGALGLALIGISVGTITSLTLSTPLIQRIGYRHALLALTPLMSAFMGIAIHADSPLALFLLLIPVGLCVGAIEVIVNMEADRTEAVMGRRIMNRAHAFWSFGFFGAGLFGAAMAQLGVPAVWQLGLAAPLVAGLTWACLADFQPAPRRGSDTQETTPLIARPTRAILVLVGVSLSAMLLEGASIDWSAIYMRSVFDAIPLMWGLAVAAPALAQALMRYFADGFVDLYSPVRVARVMQALMAFGTLTVVLAPSAVIGLIGLACIGAGTSVMFPLAMSAAAQRTDRPAAINVAAIAQISFVTFLLGPPLLGYIAEHLGLRWTFGVGLPLVVLSFALAGALGDKPVAETKKAA